MRGLTQIFGKVRTFSPASQRAVTHSGLSMCKTEMKKYSALRCKKHQLKIVFTLTLKLCYPVKLMAKLIQQNKEENVNLTKTKLISKITKVTCGRNQLSLYLFFHLKKKISLLY